LAEAGSIPTKTFGLYFQNNFHESTKLSELILGGFNKDLIEKDTLSYEFRSVRPIADEFGAWAIKLSRY